MTPPPPVVSRAGSSGARSSRDLGATLGQALASGTPSHAPGVVVEAEVRCRVAGRGRLCMTAWYGTRVVNHAIPSGTAVPHDEDNEDLALPRGG